MLMIKFASFFVLITVNRKNFVQGQTSNPPLNAAANVGDRVVINCTAGNSMIPGWRYSPTGYTPFTYISYSGNCSSRMPTRFVVESTGNENCNLIIPNATTEEGLAYLCEDGRGFDHYMLLTIIESVEVSPNSAVRELCPDDPLNITCSVKYSAVPTTPFQMFPSIMWTNLSGNSNISGTNLTPPNVTTSYLSIVVTPPTVPPYSCNVYFNASTLPPSFATNAPNYYRSTNTTQLQVGCIKLNASSISVTSYIESGICEAKILECHPYAYPPPQDIHWLDVIRNEVVNGNNITAEFGGEYACSVTNAIKTVSVTHRLDDSSEFTMAKCKSVSEVNITKSTSIASMNYQADAWNKMSLQSNANTYSCGNATEIRGNVTATPLTCTANGLPNPTYVWYDQCQNQTSTNQQIIVTTSGSYKCVASNSINGRNFIGSNTIEITPPGDLTAGSTSAGGWGYLLLLILLLLVFVVPPCVFLPYYGFSKSCRKNVNDEFPWIEKALPCMNEKGCKCSGGMILFVFCLVICGIIFVPWILIASLCCKKNSKHSQGNSISLHERNGSKNGRHQSGASPQSMSNSTGEAPSHAAPPTPSSIHLTQADPSRNSHVNYPPSRPPPSSRAMHSPSPVSASAVEYGELKIDSKPGSRKPLEPIIQNESAYAELHTS